MRLKCAYMKIKSQNKNKNLQNKLHFLCSICSWQVQLFLWQVSLQYCTYISCTDIHLYRIITIFQTYYLQPKHSNVKIKSMQVSLQFIPVSKILSPINLIRWINMAAYIIQTALQCRACVSWCKCVIYLQWSEALHQLQLHLARLLRWSARRSLCPRPSCAASPAPRNSFCFCLEIRFHKIRVLGYSATVKESLGEDCLQLDSSPAQTDLPGRRKDAPVCVFGVRALTSPPSARSVQYSGFCTISLKCTAMSSEQQADLEY